ncbi:hypothetical protein [Streptomyces solicathayae]|uniref:Lipoprotein n=1 Tax=Streptomyces solicathayae TaxID=3081768 RepID=A0ABZ0LM10_9ACTN|nr:hypothetical protein [Streptomyces sp. HUAS YS2]WOX20241.1 hypothetical protein R2D22_02070 [Streptomyces sp. HUAS YS2]
MTRPTGTRAVLATASAVLLALSAGCGAADGRTAQGTAGRPKHGADETWFTTAGVTPEDPEALLQELRAGRAPKALGLVRSGATAGASYAYVNWEWSLWPPGLRPVGVALTPVRTGGTTVAVGPVRQHGRVPELSLRVARIASDDAWTAPLPEWQHTPHTFQGPAAHGFTFQYVVEGEPSPDPLQGPNERAAPRP